MKIGILFPGQGTQSVGMGKDLYEKYDEVKEIYNKAKEITGIDIAKISFEGPEELLNETKNTQLAVLTESLAIMQVLKKNNIKAVCSAGLSLGECTALIEDEIIDFESGIKLVQTRGEIMQKYLPNGSWRMAAIIGIDENTIEDICEKVNSGFVKVANYNTIGQIVIAGEENAVMEAGDLAKEAGARKVVTLNTAGPFHTEKMKDCSEVFRKELDKFKFNNKNSKIIKNLDGSNYKESEDVKEILSKHIMSPVKFTECLNKMYENGVDTFIEVGPGKTLSGFVKRMKFERPVKILNTENAESLISVLKEVINNE